MYLFAGARQLSFRANPSTKRVNWRVFQKGIPPLTVLNKETR